MTEWAGNVGLIGKGRMFRGKMASILLRIMWSIQTRQKCVKSGSRSGRGFQRSLCKSERIIRSELGFN